MFSDLPLKIGDNTRKKAKRYMLPEIDPGRREIKFSQSMINTVTWYVSSVTLYFTFPSDASMMIT